MALRLAHPDAEVTGIDFAENTLRWAHARAEENGVAIEYSQRDATNTGFEDASFDLVTAFLFFHEIPPEVQDAAMREAHRLLEPGGQIIILDMPPYAALDPGVAYVESFDQRGNGENFWDGFLSRDRGAALEAAGFEDVVQGPLEWEDLGDWGAAALMRTGEFHPEQQWSARGTRPAS